jgi:hypothetical protein
MMMKGADMDLEELGKTVNPARGITATVLVQYEKIRAARQMLWDWRTIADAMGMPEKAAQIRQAFARITEGLKSGEVALPKAGPKLDVSGRIQTRHGQPSSGPLQARKAGGSSVNWEALSKQRKQEEDDIEWTG